MSETLEDMKSRAHSLREWEAEDFLTALDEGGAKNEVRYQLRRMEDGRFHEMLSDAHDMFARLDPDERRMWAEANQNMMEWVHVFGRLEDLHPFPDYVEFVGD